ncbi:hypothetical protein SAMN03159293_04926 [Pseudomonas sp. NFACC39-1]|nr:hypothetical protein SAMN03159293_04926 [Pseudomonas sp. NFACC39-1]
MLLTDRALKCLRLDARANVPTCRPGSVANLPIPTTTPLRPQEAPKLLLHVGREGPVRSEMRTTVVNHLSSCKTLFPYSALKKNKLASFPENLLQLEKAQREQRGEIEKAQTAEQRAAEAYAAALADGDDAAEERAEKTLKQASEATTQAAQGKRGLNTLLATLTTEIEKLDVAISDAKQRLADYRQAQLNAARRLWTERLDKAAQDFAKVAAQFTATEKALGRRYSNLEDINVPLQAPMGPKHITHRKILEMAQALSIEELLAA